MTGRAVVVGLVLAAVAILGAVADVFRLHIPFARAVAYNAVLLSAGYGFGAWLRRRTKP